MSLFKKEVLIITGVEIGFGLLEGIIMPNIASAKGTPFMLPPKEEILKTMGTLTVTGFASGFLADMVMEKWEITEGRKRTLTIAGVSIAVNVIEAIIVPNVIKKWDSNWKFETPPLNKFAGGMAFLTLTALMGGFVSDKAIAALSPLKNAPVVEPKIAEPILANI